MKHNIYWWWALGCDLISTQAFVRSSCGGKKKFIVLGDLIFYVFQGRLITLIFCFPELVNSGKKGKLYSSACPLKAQTFVQSTHLRQNCSIFDT